MADPGLEAAISGDAPFVGNFTGTSNAPANPVITGEGGLPPPLNQDLTGISEAGAGPFNATIPGPGGDPLAITENFPGGAMGTGGITGQGGTSSAPAGTDIGSLGIGTPFGTQPGAASSLPATFSPDGLGSSSLLGQNSGLPTNFTPGGVANTGNGGTSAGSSTPEGTGGVPSNTTLSPFGGGDVGSFVQWYNNLDPSLATSLYTALQKAQAPVPPAGAPQLTGPQPFTVGT